MSVIINGGGMSGVILAWILSQLTTGLGINLIEVCSPNDDLFVSDSRYIALSYSSYCKLISFFNDISFVISSCSTAIKQLEVIDIYQKKIIFSASDYRVRALGYVIELHNMRKNIFNLLKKSSAVKLFCPSKLKAVRLNRFNDIIFLEDGTEVVGELLIAADGSYSSLATLCGMQWDFFDYRQIAIITNITTSFPNEGRAFEVFMVDGSLALLPISKYKSSLIWCVPCSYKSEVSSWHSSKFCSNLQKIFGWDLGCIIDVDKRYFFSLFLRKAKCHISHRLALVGNAAQTLHPIAGQGFNLGFRDIIGISKIISEASIKNLDIGDYSILKSYQTSRVLDQYKMIAMTHSLVYLFNHSYCVFEFFRNCVFRGMQYSSLLRDILIKSVIK